MWNFDQLISWMGQNQNWSGWAQAVGATVGIIIAVAVPAYQRWAQTLDMRREKAEMNLINAQTLFFLLSDIANWLGAHLKLASMPRQAARHDIQRDDLLCRIQALEAKVTDHQSGEVLFRARGAIVQTNRAIMDVSHQMLPLTAAEIALLTERVQMLADYEEKSERSMNKAFHDYGAVRLHLFGRVLYPFIRPVIEPVVIWYLDRKGRVAEAMPRNAAPKSPSPSQNPAQL